MDEANAVPNGFRYTPSSICCCTSSGAEQYDDELCVQSYAGAQSRKHDVRDALNIGMQGQLDTGALAFTSSNRTHLM